MIKKVFGLTLAVTLSITTNSMVIAQEEASELEQVDSSDQNVSEQQEKESDYELSLNEDTGVYQLDLDKIVVTASKVEQVYKNVPVNISIISSQDIEDSGATEITELLDMLPSVDILEYGSFGSHKSVHTRGASSTQVLTLVNGRPVNTPRDGFANFNQIPLSNIERIEVMRGPAATMYGANAVGGVINIITKTGTEKMQTKIENQYGSFRTKLASFSNGYKINNFDYFISYDYLISEGHRDHTFYRTHNPNINLGYDLNEDNHISVSSGYYKSTTGTPGKINNLDLDDRQLTKKKFVDLTWNGKILQDQDILLKFYHDIDRLEFIEEYDPTTLQVEDKDGHEAKVYGLDAQFSQIWFDVWRTTFGGNYQIHKINSTANAKHKYNAKALYVESETDLFDDSVICKIGARWDDYSNFGDRISPSVSAATWLFDIIKLHGLIAKSFRAPTFNDLYWPREDYGIWGGVEGNTDLGPENAISYELGLGGYIFDVLKSDVTFFLTKSDDLIEWAMDSSLWWRPTNIGSAKIKGIEFETEYIIRDNLKLNFSYTNLDAENKDTHTWLIYRPKHLFKCRLNYQPISRFKIGLNARYKTKRFVDSENTRKLPPYFVMDANFSYEINKNLDLLFTATNIFNRAYEEEENYPVPGHAIMAGIRLSY